MDEMVKEVSTIVFDVDGVLTDGIFYVDELGHFRKGFLDKDFSAIRELKKHFRIVFLTGSEKVTEHVARMLGVQFYYEPHDKKKKLKELIRRWGVTASNVIFVGDGYVDIKCTQFIPLSFCPKDAVPELVRSKHTITLNAKGGEGVAMELYERLKQEIMRRRKYE